LLGNPLRDVPGYSLNGYWGATTKYADANHDGIIEPNEVTVASTASYMGSSVPTQSASFSTHLVVHGLSALALLDYRGGYRLYNAAAVDAAVLGAQSLRAQNDRTAPLADQ